MLSSRIVMRRRLLLLTIPLLLAGCAVRQGAPAHKEDPMKRIAESYVKLVLAVGQHDADYVDAYYGPPEWRAEAETRKRPLPEIRAEAQALISELAAGSPAPGDEEVLRLRHQYLHRQLQAMVARIDLLSGRKMTFDEEAKALYDAVAPTYTAAHFQAILDRLDNKVPRGGPLRA